MTHVNKVDFELPNYLCRLHGTYLHHNTERAERLTRHYIWYRTHQTFHRVFMEQYYISHYYFQEIKLWCYLFVLLHTLKKSFWINFDPHSATSK